MLGHSIAAALPRLRAQAESMMLDTCKVEVVTGTTTDPLTGVVTPTYSTVYGPATEPHRGRCRVTTYEAHERNPEVGGATLTVQRYAVHFPVGSFAPAKGQVITITAATFDPHLAGRKYTVVALLHKTAATAYRLGVEEVV